MQIKQLRTSMMLGTFALALVLALSLGLATDRGLQAELFGLLAFVLLGGIASGSAAQTRRSSR
jgi:hypothetical protein